MKKADNFDSSKWLVENKITSQSRLNEGKIKNKYVVKDEEESDDEYDFYYIDQQKALEYLKQFNNKEVSAKQFIKDDEGWGEFEQYLEDVEQMSDKQLEDAMREEMSFYFFSEPDGINESRLNEEENTLEQDLLDFWDLLQDDAAQSDGEYKASWDTDFFLEQHKEYKGKEAEVRKAVRQLKQQGKLSLYGKREKGAKGTESVLDFVKQNFDEVADKTSKAAEYESNQERRKKLFDEVEANPSELIEGNEDLVQMYVMLPEYVRRKPANYDYRAGYSNVPTGKEVKKPFFQMAFDKNKITKFRSLAKKIIVNGVELYISSNLV
jgi:hypothetical protein